MEERADVAHLRIVESSTPYDRSRAIAEFSSYAALHPPTEQLLAHALEILTASLSVNNALAADFDPATETLRLGSGIGWEEAVLQRLVRDIDRRIHQPLPARGTELREEIELLSPRIMEQHGIFSSLVVMIPGEHRDLGLISLFALRRYDFSDADLQFARAIANVTGMGMARESSQIESQAGFQRVERAKSEWETALDALPELVCILDSERQIVRANRAVELWQLGTVQSAVGISLHELLHPLCRNAECELGNKLQEGWHLITDWPISKWELADDVLKRDLHFTLRKTAQAAHGNGLVRNYAALVIEDASDRMGQVRDLKHRNQALRAQVYKKNIELEDTRVQLKRQVDDHVGEIEALIDLEKKYLSLAKNSLVGVYITQGNKIVFHNRRFAEIFGYTRERLHGMDVSQLVDFNTVYSVDEDVEPSIEDRVIRGLKKDGGKIWMRMNISRLGRTRVLGCILDTTQQKQVEETLRQSERELKGLSSRLIAAQEIERKRIASELHDGIGQSMSAIKFGIENILEELGDDADSQPVRNLEAVVEKIRESIEEVRRISMDLRPSTLDDLGIVATIGWFCREFQSVLAGTEIVKRIEVEESDVDDSLKVVIFRIIQEALNNIAKHAGASVIYVELIKTEEQICLGVEDNGKGFLVNPISSVSGGFGLKSMKERAESSRGSLQALSVPGAGSVIKAVWPLHQE